MSTADAESFPSSERAAGADKLHAGDGAGVVEASGVGATPSRC